MPLVKQLVKRLTADFSYTFTSDELFKWSADTQTITYIDTPIEEAACLLLHELGHAELGHQGYSFDIDLLKQETDAWQHALTTLGPRYKVAFTSDYIEDCLDTYRDWLHHRSLCPICYMTGLQTKTNTYSCINCRCLWRVNNARLCGLKRFRVQPYYDD